MLENTMSLPQLLQYTSDYHKDTYGYRPMLNSMRDPEDTRKECMVLLAEIEEFLQRMQESDAGRDSLQDNHWII